MVKSSSSPRVARSSLRREAKSIFNKNLNVDEVLASTQKRGHIFMMAFMVVFSGLMVACFWVQVVKSDYWQSYGESQYLRTEEKEGKRGNIMDRNNNMLAMSEPFARIEAEPIQFGKVVARYKSAEDLNDLEQRIEQLALGLKMNVGELKEILYSSRSYVVLAQGLQPQLAESILSKPLPAVRIKEYQSRIYPTGEVSAQIVGVMSKKKRNMGEDSRGSIYSGEDGLELIYEPSLKSVSGTAKFVRDPSGRTLEPRDFVKPVDGKSINISLDVRIQQYAYKALSDMIKHTKARDGAVVVMDTLSGEILAMVGYPSYDPKNRESINLLNLRNIALTDIFEPGSTMKPFFASLALENNLVQPTTMFDVLGGQITISGHTIKDTHKSPRGTLMSVKDIIAHSSNVGIIKVSERLERKEMWEMLDQLGFGKSLPFSLPGTVSGRFNDYRRWQTLDKATITFGSTLSANLMQIVRAYSVFARDGEVIQPTLEYSPIAARGKKVFSSKTIKMMNAILEASVNQGSGKLAQVPGFRVAGKTGTAKKFINGVYADKYISTFVGFAPVSQPRLLIAVMVNEPSAKTSTGYYGGAVAAPVFAQVMGHALRLLGIKPDRFQDDAPPSVKASVSLPVSEKASSSSTQTMAILSANHQKVSNARTKPVEKSSLIRSTP